MIGLPIAAASGPQRGETDGEPEQSWSRQPLTGRAFGAIAILLIGWWVSRLMARLIRRVMDRARVDPTLIAFAANMAYTGLMALVVTTALGQVGVPTTSFAAILGASALAIGFALRGRSRTSRPASC